jgi:hypothetical protein
MTDRPQPRTLDVRVRLTAEEKAQVEALAREERLTVSDLIRERLGLPLMVARWQSLGEQQAALQARRPTA